MSEPPAHASAPRAASAPRPVVVGGDIGAYATARAFHEAYGVRTVVLATLATGAVARSRIVDLRIVPDLADPDVLVETLRGIAAEPGGPPLVLGSADWLVQQLVAERHRLEDVLVVPYAPAPVVDAIGDKAELMARCAAAGVPHPATRVLVPGRDDHTGALVGYPQVLKAASTSEIHDVSYTGKAKVHLVHTPDELDAVLAAMAAARFSGRVLAQEYVPGGDDAMGAVNVFCAPRAGGGGDVTFAQLGQVLLEDHTPSALGNSVAQLTRDARAEPGALETITAVGELLREAGWVGFANVDLKRGPDGVWRVLEVNPRVGRSGFAVTASGYNVARMYVDAFGPRAPRADAGNSAAPTPHLELGVHEHLFTLVPLALLRRYLDPAQRRQVSALRRRGAVTNPLYYAAERDPRRWAYVVAAMVNQVRKFRRHHPWSRAGRTRAAQPT
ncbi:ATP-grasp protein [Beutenbergia cavernae DSM 12333]|uniref:ATP-grasp protein n=1 Tax=Beutenbergia cavernae (strain ATCC BAA-8 / DSM 12333 / CCUG 43141 / JCM 11478 / NBRC 16432 / NCIMB 13614 / HKI 0122) TaxID=471853 RepID=C5C5N0_BEUC1|nr:ATP-grasp protein [Beutenbergia cavernae]ACQ80221.1 ATP-grasp protein [Beutenbergia cavernae DSM 12333]